MKIYTLVHIADWEGGTHVFATHADLWKHIESDAQEVADDTGELIPNDPLDWLDFIHEHGWKVQHYDWAEHDVDGSAGEEMFDMTPREKIVCQWCGVPIARAYEDPADSWHDADGAYPCPARNKEADHRPAPDAGDESGTNS